MSGKLLQGIKELHQFMDGEGNFLLPFGPVFLRLLQSLGAPKYMDYPFVLSVSGAATRLSWQQGWAEYKGEPNQSELFVCGDRLRELRRGCEGAGVDYEILLLENKRDWWREDYSSPVQWTNGERARRDIVASIDKGVPVLSHGMDSPYCLVIGYENDGESLDLLHPFIEESKKTGESRYMKTGAGWEDKMTMYCLVRSFAPRAVDEGLLRHIMEGAVHLARLEELPKLGNTALGLASFDALAEHLVWDDGFRELPVKGEYEGKLSWQYDRPESWWREDGAKNLSARFWAGYCDFLCMLNGYCELGKFLSDFKDVVPEWANKLEAASRYLFRAGDYTGDLWKYVTPDEAGVEKFRTDDVRSIFSAHMLRAKIFTKRTIEIFEELLGQ